MSTTESLTRAAMMGDITHDEFDLATDISMRVEYVIMCPITGRVLDTRTAVLLTVLDQKYVVHPDALQTVEPTLDDKYPGQWSKTALPEAALKVLS